MASHENRTAFLTLRGVLIWQFGRDLLALEIGKQEQRPALVKETCRTRSACGYDNLLAKITDPSGSSRIEQQTQSAEGIQHQDMDLDASVFLNSNNRLERLEEGVQLDLLDELAIEHGELMDAIDNNGGLQVKNGQYIENLDFRCGADSDDESSVDAGSEDQSALSGCSESGSESEDEDDECK